MQQTMNASSYPMTETNQNTQPFTGKYQPFGTPYSTSGSELFRYTGKQLDQSTGLHYYGFRYTDSQVGQFTTPDNAQRRYYNPQTINRYTYAVNNPNRYVDPTGAQSDDIIITKWGMLSLIGKVLKAASSSSSSSPSTKIKTSIRVKVTTGGLSDNIIITGLSQYSQFSSSSSSSVTATTTVTTQLTNTLGPTVTWSVTATVTVTTTATQTVTTSAVTTTGTTTITQTWLSQDPNPYPPGYTNPPVPPTPYVDWEALKDVIGAIIGIFFG